MSFRTLYFQVVNGHFVRDLELGFDYTKITQKSFESAQKTNWKIWVDCSGWSDKGSKTETFIDLNYIPPSIFLLAITNGMSQGLSLFIPTDMSYQKFFEIIALEFSKCIPGVSKMPNIIPELNHNTLDLHHLNESGVIHTRSVMKWNNYWLRNDRIWILDGNCLNSIQGIIQSAKKFWTLVRA